MKNIIQIIFIFTLLSSCQIDSLEETINESKNFNEHKLSSEVNERTSNDTEIVLGQQLQNPFTPTIMQTAYDNIKSSNPFFTTFNVRTTHKYIKLSPSSYSELDSLIANSEIELFDHPLDYEILVDGDYYHDPAIPYDTIHPTFQYGVVSSDYDFNKISSSYTVISDLYLPDEDPDLLAIIASNPNPKPGKENPIERDMDILIDEALFLTNNLPASEAERGIRPPRWTPSGTLTITDNQLQSDIGLEGAKVKIRRWFKVAIEYTDVNGNFTSGKKFRRDVRYKVKWEYSTGIHKWDIRRGFYGQARTGGPKKEGPWIETFSDGMDIMYGTINRGCYDFFYHDPYGLEKPSARIKIAALDKCGTGVNHHIASIIGGPDIKVYRKMPNDSPYDQCEPKNSLIIYSTTIHELGHSQHRSLGVAKFIFSPSKIRESYANMIEWVFVMNRYAPQKIYDSNSTTYNWLRNWTTTTEFSLKEMPGVSFSFPEDDPPHSNYTTMFIDLIDCVSGNTSFNDPYSELYELVCNYSPKEIEQAIKKKGWATQLHKVLQDVDAYLKDNYSNSSEIYIQNYFCRYYDCQ